MRRWPALDLRPGVSDWDLIQAALTDFDVAAIDDNAADAWRVFFHTPGGRDDAAAHLSSVFADLAIEAVDVDDEEWAARSQAELRAVRVGRLLIAPPWDIGGPGATDAITIVIQPSMGFGTGHHATTRLCLAHLQELDLRGRTVLDVGTGSGVLAIAASRLGATHVVGLDDDPDAIQSARESVRLNPGADVTVSTTDLRRLGRTGEADRTRAFDVLLANLTGALLSAAAGHLVGATTRRGRLILSGFMETEEPQVLAAFASCRIEHRSQEEEWVCVTLLRSH